MQTALILVRHQVTRLFIRIQTVWHKENIYTNFEWLWSTCTLKLCRRNCRGRIRVKISIYVIIQRKLRSYIEIRVSLDLNLQFIILSDMFNKVDEQLWIFIRFVCGKPIKYWLKLLFRISLWNSSMHFLNGSLGLLLAWHDWHKVPYGARETHRFSARYMLAGTLDRFPSIVKTKIWFRSYRERDITRTVT